MEKVAAEKLAGLVKIAEINGVMGALLENKIIKIASDEDYEIIAEAVAERLPEDYDVDAMLAVVDEVMDEYAALEDDAAEAAIAEEEAVKEASTKEEATKEASDKTAEPTEEDLLAMYGYLHLSKEAGEITEAQFKKEAGFIGTALGRMGRAAKKGLNPKHVGSRLKEQWGDARSWGNMANQAKAKGNTVAAGGARREQLKELLGMGRTVAPAAIAAGGGTLGLKALMNRGQ